MTLRAAELKNVNVSILSTDFEITQKSKKNPKKKASEKPFLQLLQRRFLEMHLLKSLDIFSVEIYLENLNDWKLAFTRAINFERLFYENINFINLRPTLFAEIIRNT